MEDLIKRLEAAEVGSRELDASVAKAFGAKDTVAYGDPALGNYYTAPAYFAPVTTSLDAALALAERVLPGWQITFSTNAGEMLPWVQIYPMPIEEDNYLYPEFATTPALAICIAILRAKLIDTAQNPR